MILRNPQPWPIALAHYTGRSPALVASHVTARHPTDAEAAALHLTHHDAVLVRDDTHTDAHGNPIDHTRSVWPGDTTRLTAHYPLGDS
ncbi:UTRA domain-containing protein [Actinoallomurus purpureus]|uniref:UTRA domain-containing protein n=1 Tax=Actinoallomurus purpureus TaxID=478114 RepID=UPI002091F78D|nr:UTRA domain-containing protein [Actinoallomurus purpureus]MCO6006895.1 UTRA domain-containing protein [Actinoallomurus purpureus]